MSVPTDGERVLGLVDRREPGEAIASSREDEALGRWSCSREADRDDRQGSRPRLRQCPAAAPAHCGRQRVGDMTAPGAPGAADRGRRPRREEARQPVGKARVEARSPEDRRRGETIDAEATPGRGSGDADGERSKSGGGAASQAGREAVVWKRLSAGETPCTRGARPTSPTSRRTRGTSGRARRSCAPTTRAVRVYRVGFECQRRP